MGAPTQTTYAENQDAGLPGMKANAERENVFSRTVETAAGIGFGVPVAKGAADRGCVIMANGLTAIGVSKRNPAVAPSDGDKYAQLKEAGISDEGTYWVRLGENVANRAQAFWNPATSKWVAGPADATHVKIDGVIYDAAGVANGIGKIKVRIAAV